MRKGFSKLFGRSRSSQSQSTDQSASAAYDYDEKASFSQQPLKGAAISRDTDGVLTSDLQKKGDHCSSAISPVDTANPLSEGDDMQLASGPGEQTSNGDDSGGGHETTSALPNTFEQVRKLLLDAPGGVIDAANFKAKWREKYGTDLVLPANANLYAFLSKAANAGYCRLAERSTTSNFLVYAPDEGERDIRMPRLQQTPPLSSPQPGPASHSSGGGHETNSALHTGTFQKIKMLLDEAPEGVIAGTDFKAKWRERYGTELVLRDNVRLKAFLSEAANEGYCRLEMRKMPKGPDHLYVFKSNEMGRESSTPGLQPTPSPSSLQRGPASPTVAKFFTSAVNKLFRFSATPKTSAPAAFDGASAEHKGQTVDMCIRPTSVRVAEVVKTSFEKARWLLCYEATREKLASAAFDGVSVVDKLKNLEVCVRYPGNTEQLRAAAELGAALRRVAAGLQVSEPLSLPGVAWDDLMKDHKFKRLERIERVLALKPKKSTVPAFTVALEVRLVSDNASAMDRVQAHLSAVHTFIEHELVFPPEWAYLKQEWIEHHFLRPAEESHKVKILFYRVKSNAPFVAESSGDGRSITSSLSENFQRTRMLLREAPEGVMDAANFKSKWRVKYGSELALPINVKLTAFLTDAANAGACRLEPRSGPGPLVHAVASIKTFCRIRGVPWRVAGAKAAIEAAVRVSKVTSLKKYDPEPELVEELRKKRQDLLRSGVQSSRDYDNNCSGRLLISVYAFPPPTYEESIPFVKVTLAMAPMAAGSEKNIDCTEPPSGQCDQRITFEAALQSFDTILRTFGNATFKSNPSCNVNGSGAGAAADTVPSSKASSGVAKELLWDDLKVEKDVVGVGSFGEVRRGYWRGMEVAIKSITTAAAPNSKGAAASEAAAKDLRNEAAILARVCNHQFVVEFVGFVPDHLAVVMGFMPKGSLKDNLYDYTSGSSGNKSHASCAMSQPQVYGSPAKEAILVRMALQAALGLQHLHSEEVIHRDVAARNVLVDDNLNVRVADFGFARLKLAGRSQKGVYTTSNVGPIKWSAPEAMRKNRYSEASDVFSFGVLLYEMVARCAPWRGHLKMDVVALVCQGKRMSLPSQVANWNLTHGDDDDDDEDWCGEAGTEMWDLTSEGQNGDNSGSSGATDSVGSGDASGEESAATITEGGQHQSISYFSSSAGEVKCSQKDAASTPKPIIAPEVESVDTGEAETGTEAYEKCPGGDQQAASTGGDASTSGNDISGSHGATCDDGYQLGGSSTSLSESKLLHVSPATVQPLEALMVRCWAQSPDARPSMGNIASALEELHSQLLKKCKEEEISSSDSSDVGVEKERVKNSVMEGAKEELNQSIKKIGQPLTDANGEVIYSNYADASPLWEDNYHSSSNASGHNDSDGRNHANLFASTPDSDGSSSTFQNTADASDLNNAGGASPQTCATTSPSSMPSSSAFSVEVAATASAGPISGLCDLVLPDASQADWDRKAPDNANGTMGEAATGNFGPISGFGEVVQPDPSLAAWDWQAADNLDGMNSSFFGSDGGNEELLSATPSGPKPLG